jgi:hypothetical protein
VLLPSSFPIFLAGVTGVSGVSATTGLIPTPTLLSCGPRTDVAEAVAVSTRGSRAEGGLSTFVVTVGRSGRSLTLCFLDKRRWGS